jgi:hypothetical protein
LPVSHPHLLDGAGPAISAIWNVSPGLIATEGNFPALTVAPGLAPVPSVAIPPMPLAPVKFSGEMGGIEH